MNNIRYFYRTKRKKVLIATALLIPIIFAVLLLLSLVNGSTGSFNDPGTGMIVIDPGHGGFDAGASTGGFLEKEINLSISRRLKKILEDKGFKVILTRNSDDSPENSSPDDGDRVRRDLLARASIINRTDAQLFLSIHVNSDADNQETCGSVVFYAEKFEQSPVLADCVQYSLNGLAMNKDGRGAHTLQVSDNLLLNMARMPGIIIGTAYITNYNERLLLVTDEFRDGIAASIAEGVLAYYEKLGIKKPEAAGKTS